MNILLIGSGGREHALAWRLAQSPLCTRLFTAPGNPGTARHGTNRPDVSVTDHAAVAAFCAAES
ncbi:phosphoribosylamine--glycine ligase N-terminal domain-containing protein, partial [Acinetobacter baumannii]